MTARHAPATARNRDPILAVLREILPSRGTVLEVASGTGEHAAAFAAALTALGCQTSDPDADARASIDAWCAGLANVRPALALDAAAPDWPVAGADAILCINMVHISPWAATEGLMAGAARLLAPGAPLYLYGPYRRAEIPTAPSNEAFDADLRTRNPDWGLRALEDVTALAALHGLLLERVIEMPANNLSVIFRRR
jgi:SAM-dependent methyltransferase